MGKKIGIAALSLGVSLLVFGLIFSVTSNKVADSSSAAKMSKNTANQIDYAVKNLDTVENQDFNFPSVFGSDFFVDDTQCQNGECGHTHHASKMPVTQEPAKQRSTRSNRTGGKRYMSRHVDVNTLNFDSATRNNYLDSLDDLYVLCADVSCANGNCNQKVLEIKKGAAELKELAAELRQTNIQKNNQNAATFDSLNKHNAELKKALNVLNRDRGRLSTRVKNLPKDTGSMSVENANLRYTTVMNKVEERMKMLNEVCESINKLCDCLTSLLGKTRQSPASIQTNPNPTAAQRQISKTEPQQPPLPALQQQEQAQPQTSVQMGPFEENPNSGLTASQRRILERRKKRENRKEFDKRNQPSVLAPTIAPAETANENRQNNDLRNKSQTAPAIAPAENTNINRQIFNIQSQPSTVNPATAPAETTEFKASADEQQQSRGRYVRKVWRAPEIREEVLNEQLALITNHFMSA